jgi:hypothetical protein
MFSQGVVILEILDINQGGGNDFWTRFTFPTGFYFSDSNFFSIEFFVIDRSYVHLVIK